MFKFEPPSNGWPDFMDKGEKKKSYESKTILGKIFRAVKVQGSYKEIQKKEFYYSFQLKYKLLPWIFTKNGFL